MGLATLLIAEAAAQCFPSEAVALAQEDSRIQLLGGDDDYIRSSELIFTALLLRLSSSDQPVVAKGKRVLKGTHVPRQVLIGRDLLFSTCASGAEQWPKPAKPGEEVLVFLDLQAPGGVSRVVPVRSHDGERFLNLLGPNPGTRND